MSEARPEPALGLPQLELLRRLTGAALEVLERERQRIDGLNVFPVPDGDTGQNLVATLGSLLDELETAVELGRPLARRSFARALLMGARGNSGLILSQIVRGLVEAAPASLPVDAQALAPMLARARDAAYAAVQRPVEGTMLTLMSELAEEAGALRRKRLSSERFLQRLVERGEQALARTPEQLAVLRDSGVVDAGAAGTLEFLKAITAELSDEGSGEAPVRLRLVSSQAAD